MAQNYSQNINYSPVGTPVGTSVSGGTLILTPSGQVIDYPFRVGGRFAGRGGIQRADSGDGVPASFASPQVERANRLAIQRPSLERESATNAARVDAFNRLQNAINSGQPIPRDATQILGINNSTDLIGSRFEALRSKLQTENISVKSRLEGYNKELSGLQADIAKPTAIEQQVGASLLDRGASIQLLQRAQQAKTTGIPASFESPQITQARLQQAQQQAGRARLEAAPIPEPPWYSRVGKFGRETLFSSLPTAIFGMPETEKPYFEVGEESKKVYTAVPFFTRKKGVAQRTGQVFLEQVKTGIEIGRGYAGEPGAFFGSIGGLFAGTFFGISEATAGTAATTIGLTTEKFAGKTVGELSETGARLLLTPRSYAKIGGAILGGAGIIAPKAISAVKGFETAKSIYAATPLTNYLTYGVGVAAKVAPAAQKAIQSPFVKYPALYGYPLVAPTVYEKVVLGAEKKVVQDARFEPFYAKFYQEDIQKAAVPGAPLPSFTFGGTQYGIGDTTGALGQSLGLGVFGIEATGGGDRKESFELAKQRAREGGYTGAEVEKVAKIAVRARYFRQLGGLTGFVAIETLGEVSGRKLIGDSLTDLLTGKVIGLGAKQAFKQTVKITAKQAPKFVALGIQEGLLGQATSDLLTRQAKTPAELPKVIAEDPFKYAAAGLAGGISAPLLGLPVLGSGVFKTLKASKSTTASLVGKGFLGAGYILDPLEEAGDYLANFLGRTEPRFKIKTISGTATETYQLEGKKVSVKTKTPLSILQPFGEPTTQEIPTRSRAKGLGSIFGFSEPSSIYNPQPQPAPTNIPSGVNVPSSIDQIFADFVGTEEPAPEPQQDITNELNENVPQDVPVIFNVPVGVPSSKLGVPPFFPIFPSGGEGGGGRGYGGRKYLNEFYAASSLLGSNLRKQGLKVAREKRSPLDNFLKPRFKKRSIARRASKKGR